MNEKLPYNNVLRMSGEKFRILTVSAPNADAGNRVMIAESLTEMIDRTSPEFVFFCGDITRDASDTEKLRETLAVILAPVIERGLPWAHVFGDMDRVNGLPNDAAMPVYRSFAGCLSEAGAESADGCGNYLLPLTDESGNPLFCLYGLDSHSGVHDYEADYGSPTRARLANTLYGNHYLDGIRFNQSMFYWKTSKTMEQQYGRKIPSMILFHTPIPEMTYLPMNPYQTKVQGVQRETVRCQVVAGGLFTAAIERGDVRAIFAGHSEHNDFHGTYGRILMGQMRDFTLRDGTFTGGTLFEIGRDGNVGVSDITI
jgi:hypothetical protein